MERFEWIFEPLEFGETRKTVRYLGYPLPLTETEYVLLLRLRDADGWLTREELADCCRCGNAEAVSVHLSALNRKAKAIGGRSLILSKRGMGYRLTDEP
jgi:DNA-binding response OmpR family regulator